MNPEYRHNHKNPGSSRAPLDDIILAILDDEGITHYTSRNTKKDDVEFNSLQNLLKDFFKESLRT